MVKFGKMTAVKPHKHKCFECGKSWSCLRLEVQTNRECEFQDSGLCDACLRMMGEPVKTKDLRRVLAGTQRGA